MNETVSHYVAYEGVGVQIPAQRRNREISRQNHFGEGIMSGFARFCLCVFALITASLSGLAANHILFARLGPTQGRLYISKADGSGEHPLTKSDSLNYDPSWSPKGDWIVFTSERAGPANLYRIHPNGTGLELLTNDTAFDDQAAFSPDGKRIVFVSTRATGRANLWILDIATHKARRLTRNGDGGDFRPSWSPDGKWIAFSSDRGNSLPFAKGRFERLQLASIYLIHPDGRGLKRITKPGGFCGSPKWTRDNKSVVAYCMSAQDTWNFRAGREDGEDQLVKIDISSGKVMPIVAGPGVKLLPTLLPSGKIAYLRFDKTAKGVFYDMGTPGPAGAGLRTPSWSPDGSRVAYSRYVFNRKILVTKQWSRNKNFDLYGTAFLPDYDPSGKDLAVTVLNPGGTVHNPGSKGMTLLINDEDKPPHPILKWKDLILGPQWSPDGKQIAVGVGKFTDFLNFEIGAKEPVPPADGGAQVAILNADGSNFHLVTSGPDNNAFPSFAPDGKHIVYRTQGPNGNGLRIMDPATHSVKVLTNGWGNFPQWSPRGNLIEFTRKADGNYNIFTIHPDGTDLKQLTHTRGNDAHAAWSPDGEWLVFASSRMGFKDEVLLINNPQPYGEIFVMRSDGTHVEQLTDDKWEEGVPCWQPGKPALAAVTVSSH
jgi:TolB protein